MTEENAFSTLAAKLRGLDLTDDERRALTAVLQLAEGGDVEGYVSLDYGTVQYMKGADLGGAVGGEFGSTHSKPFKGTDEELQTILDWLGSLEAQG